MPDFVKTELTENLYSYDPSRFEFSVMTVLLLFYFKVLIPCNGINFHHEENEGHEEKIQGRIVLKFFMTHIDAAILQPALFTTTAITF